MARVRDPALNAGAHIWQEIALTRLTKVERAKEAKLKKAKVKDIFTNIKSFSDCGYNS